MNEPMNEKDQRQLTQRMQQDMAGRSNESEEKRLGQGSGNEFQPYPSGPRQTSDRPTGGQGSENLSDNGTDDRDNSEGRWGDMKDAEREQAIQYLREKFPGRYRDLIERYYRALAEEDTH